MSDYNRQFLFNTPTAAYPVQAKLSLKQRLAKKTTVLSFGAAIALGALIGAASGAAVGVGFYTYISKPAPIVVNNSANVTWVTAAAAAASPSVVTINVSGASGAGNGSGVVLSADGYVLTNAHVVTLDGSEASVNIEVKTSDGHIYGATVVGIDATNDLAVIKVASPIAMTPIAFADSNRLNVGDEVVALGAPLGLSNTVTQGIVSALNRTIQVASSEAPENSDNGGGGLQFFSGSGNAINLRVIQTDAAINPGNSGGALVNQSGQLIGINVAIASAGSTGTSGSIGVGFAIPANVAQRVANEIIKTGSASHGLLGAAVADATNSDNSASFSVGAEVKELTAGGAAEKGGLKVGDIVTKFNGVVVSSASELTAAVRQEPAAAMATVEFLRDGKTQTIKVTLGNSADLN